MTAAPEAARVAFGDFVEREKLYLYGAMCLVTHDRHEAEEIVQDAFVRILEHWDRIAGMEDPRGYLYRTAMNVFRSRYRGPRPPRGARFTGTTIPMRSPTSTRSMSPCAPWRPCPPASVRPSS